MVRRNFQKSNTVLFFCFLVIMGLYFGAPILIPIAFAVFLSALVVPLSNTLEKKVGAGRVTSSMISALVLFFGIGIMLFFLFRQFGIFLSDLVERREEIVAYVGVLQDKIMDSTGFTLEQQEKMFNDRLNDILTYLQGLASTILGHTTELVGKFLLILIYVFLLLLNRDKFVRFLMMYTPGKNKGELKKILRDTRKVAYKYLWGRIQVMVLLGTLYAITFFAYGLKHALLLILFGTVITVIPFIGPLISGTLPILFMIVFGGSTFEIISFAVLVIIIQLIESYVLEPVIIGSEVEQNPLFVIFAIILGGAIWGMAGLILFVPIFAILKIIFDHNKELKPIGFLIGYERPGSSENFIEKIRKKIKK